MNDAMVAALVSGVVSLLVSFGGRLWEERRKRGDERLAARARLDVHREPLLAAADGLGSRVSSIRNDGFLDYLTVPERRHTAIVGTSFRFAQFFGWIEITYGRFGYLRFVKDHSTTTVAKTLRAIARTLAQDRLDRHNPADFTTTQLMIWREEQRAIGEAMRAEGEPPQCISFNTFVRTYDERFASWFSAFTDQLDPQSTPNSERLAKLQRLLAQLIQELDIDGLVVSCDDTGTVIEPRWARPMMLGSVTSSSLP